MVRKIPTKAPTKATVTPIKKGRTVNKEVQLKIRVDSSDAEAIYANYMEVSHSQYEFMLTVARMPARLESGALEVAKERGEIVVEPQVQILFPPKIIAGLIEALKIQKEKYESTFGKITMMEDHNA